MLESHLREGRQELVDKTTLTYGQSITDGCIGFDATVDVLQSFADDVRAGNNLRATA
jgi:3-deoxy-7-phosphoheptulonate synthase